MTHHDAADIVPSGHLQQRVLSGRVNYIHRTERVAEEGDTFEISTSAFEITDVTERSVRDLDRGDIRQEEANTMDQYRQRLQSRNPDFEWGDDSTLYRYAFKRRLSLDDQ